MVAVVKLIRFEVMIYNKIETCKICVDESMHRHVRSLSLNHSLRFTRSPNQTKSSLVCGENEITKQRDHNTNKTIFFTVEKTGSKLLLLNKRCD